MEEAAYLMFEDGTVRYARATAVVTLGSEVDLLQERYRTPDACWKAICLRVSAENF